MLLEFIWFLKYYTSLYKLNPKYQIIYLLFFYLNFKNLNLLSLSFFAKSLIDPYNSSLSIQVE